MFVLAFCLPLALYLLALGVLNSRRHPVFVSGPWDFAGILFAGSGFLLYGGPLALSMFSENMRMQILLGKSPFSGLSPDFAWYVWLVLSILYFLAVVAAAYTTLRRRTRVASVYNVRTDSFPGLLENVFARAGVQATRAGNSYILKPVPWITAAGEDPKPAEASPSRAGLSPDDLAAQTAVLDVDTFRGLCHVSLSWDPVRCPLREDVERELTKELARTYAPANWLWFWFSSLAFLVFGIGFAGTIVVFVYRLAYRLW